MVILYIIIFVFCLGAYFLKQYTLFLLSYFALMSHLFMLDTSEVTFKPDDLCIVINTIILTALLHNNRRLIFSGHDLLTKYIWIFLGFYFFEWLWTFTSDMDSALNGFKVIRHILIFPVYFILKTIPQKVYNRFLKILFYITIIQGILFLLQQLDVHLIYGFKQETHTQLGFSANYPPLTLFYFFFCLKWKYTKRWRSVILIYLFVIVAMTGIRALIIAILIGALYFIIQEYKTFKTKRLIYLIVLFILLVPISLIAIQRKTINQGGVSTTEDIRNIVSTNSNLTYYQKGSGTLSFRIAMLIERWNYLVDNPQYLMFGVGTIHEDSPACYRRFNFALGTNNEERHYGHCLIESGDIAWVPVLLRYGIVGVIIHVSFFLVVFKYTWKRKDIWTVIAPLYLCYFIKSFDGAFFELSFEYFILSIIIVCMTKRCSEIKRFRMKTDADNNILDISSINKIR